MTTGPITILLVEDDSLLREAFRMLLEDAGYDVREAGTAAEALAAVDPTPPALVLLDLGLPDRSGLEVAREFSAREDMRDVPIVALTGRSGPEERKRCIDAGCSDFLAKPVEPFELLRRVPDLLQSRRT